MTEFKSGQPGDVVHSALKSAVDTMDKARQNAILWFGEIVERKLYLDKGYSSIHLYAEQELGFSKSKTYDFLNICRRLEDLPQVKGKVESGELGYTGTLEILKATSPENQGQWIEVALNNSSRDLAREVKLAKKEAADKKTGQPTLIPEPETRPAAVVPVKVSLVLSPAQFARYEALRESIRKQGGAPGDRVEALLEMMAAYEPGFSKRLENRGSQTKPPVQINIHQCPDCEKATVQTSKGELTLSQAELEQAQCDCQISHPGQRNTTSIPPKTKREVLAQARHRCQRPGCNNANYLEVHHKVPRSNGGTNDPSNLTVLCHTCHRLLHEKKSAHTGFFVKSPEIPYGDQILTATFKAYPAAGPDFAIPLTTACCDAVLGGHHGQPAFPRG